MPTPAQEGWPHTRLCIHASEGANEADLDEKDDGWLDLGPEDPEENQIVLGAKIQEAKDHALSTTSRKDLEMLLLEFDAAVKLKLDAAPPDSIEPLRIQHKPNAIPVRTKQRLYPQLKGEFMSKYIGELLRLFFAKKVYSP